MDLDVIKQRLEALQKPTSNNNNGKSLFWKPSVGKQTVRIVPSKFNKATTITTTTITTTMVTITSG